VRRRAGDRALTAFLVHHFLEHQARAHPDRELLVTHDPGAGRWTYAHVDAAANRHARLFEDRGVARGDRVAILAHNGIEYVAAWFGALKLGAIAVPLNPANDPGSLAGCISDCGARVLYVGPRLDRMIARAELAVPIVRVADADGRDDGALAPRAIIDLDPAAIIYTSGSTGRPRGATLTHLAMVSNARSIVDYLGLAAEDRVLQVLPLHYVYGKSLLTTATAVGATLVIENRFQYPAVALDTLEREACTGFAGVPSTFAILIHRSNFAERAMPALRWVTQAGGGMSPALTRDVIAALGGRRLHVMYGATEASARLAHLAPDELPAAIGSIGRAIPNVELTVRRADGAPCDVDEVGELFARGSNLMTGYWNDMDETARVLGAHGYATGDLARRDAAGLLWLVGRKKDLLKVGGHRVAAREIEDAIAEHPAVAEVAVIGEPDEILGDRLVAFVVPRAGATIDAQALGGFLSERVAAYKLPSRVEQLSELPKNSSGKVMKDALRGR
jgi:acyl-CoA synthetase (AMP-forming)/AMP-acid ligase II